MRRYFALGFLLSVMSFRAQDTVKVAIPALTEQQAEQNYNLGIEAMQKRDYQLAISLFSNCLLIKPAFDKAYANRAIALTQIKKYAEALKDINAALYYNSDNPEYFFNKSLIFWGMHEKDSQVVALDQCLKMNR
jgi:tetratricopeptide (TPR) repeat protein